MIGQPMMSIMAPMLLMLVACVCVCVCAVAAPTPADIAALRATITGTISQYGDAIYKASVTIDNGRFTAQPILIVYPLVNHDIALSLAFAQRFELDFTVRGGGHSAAGWGLSNGMVYTHILDIMHPSIITIIVTMVIIIINHTVARSTYLYCATDVGYAIYEWYIH